ncbi:MAG: nitronate monooxygenase [Hyphomicrobiales bacterium]|nr:nitronate monooxygenase [Hyphomicrobiales bacterium]
MLPKLDVNLVSSRGQLDELWRPGTDFLGSRYAIMGGAMSWVSEQTLVSAISEAGGFGVLACGSLEADQLSAEIRGVQKRTRNPFGVNLIIMHPRLNELIDVCLQSDVSHIVLAGGVPTSAVIQRIKDGGAKVICFASTTTLARRLIRHGADALIIEGAEAGGHIGPVATSVLAQEILPHIQDVPVFVAGGIGRGEAISFYLRMGAAGCQIGTRFVCAQESIAHPDFKRAFIRAHARDAILSVQIDPDLPVIPVRALANAGTRRFVDIQRQIADQYRSGELDQVQAQLEIELYWAGALRRAVIDGDVENGSLMAGQSVGMVTREQPMAEIMEELVTQARTVLAENERIGFP